MKVLQKYLAIQIIQAVIFVLIALLALFSFFDLTGEVQEIGRGGYRLQHALLYVLLGLPGYVYDILPIAALVGSIYALALLASHSEFTIMRVSGMSTAVAIGMLIKIGVGLVVLTFVFGEFIAPISTIAAEKIKSEARGSTARSNQFRTGLWTKDLIKEDGMKGAVIGSRFLNVQENRPDGKLIDIKLYEFDPEFRLQALVLAKSAKFQGGNEWLLEEVSETRFLNAKPGNGTSLLETFQKAITEQGTLITTHHMATKLLISEITPKVISVLFTDPGRMSAYDLLLYERHLAENKQDTQRYQLAFWKKIIYPFAVLVMMALALPFAYLHVRAGGVSLKILIGVMIGVSFHLLNSLASTLGVLNTWHPFATIISPSLLFLVIAMSALWWMERH